jgi:membrane-associated phospholipid phosphatase
MATLWFWSVFIITGKKWYWLWFWAGLICFAQVYVGKHYPFDILGGSIFGWASGATSAKIFERWAINPPLKRMRGNLKGLDTAAMD